MNTYCARCGKELGLEARFCSACGTRNAAATLTAAPTATRLVRPRSGRIIAGVCQGLALSYGWDVVWVRVVTVLAAVFSSGAGGIAYIIFWIVMPEELYALPAPGSYPPGATYPSGAYPTATHPGPSYPGPADPAPEPGK